ncbi:MAG: hypothetical protein EB015_01105 [Methylocystaceae bacterium]|jgi:hypothetical protein|nr:hypothetical protein [Methylocystaceae bacterium]
MNERGPFANWPRLEGAVREISVDDAQRFSKPIDMESQTMASKNNALENFLGGAPMNVLARLFFISLVVGALMMWLELRPIDILNGVQAFFDRIAQLGFGAVRELGSYIMAGAIVVVPVWFVLRLISVAGMRR